MHVKQTGSAKHGWVLLTLQSVRCSRAERLHRGMQQRGELGQRPRGHSMPAAAQVLNLWHSWALACLPRRSRMGTGTSAAAACRAHSRHSRHSRRSALTSKRPRLGFSLPARIFSAVDLPAGQETGRGGWRQPAVPLELQLEWHRWSLHSCAWVEWPQQAEVGCSGQQHKLAACTACAACHIRAQRAHRYRWIPPGPAPGLAAALAACEQCSADGS